MAKDDGAPKGQATEIEDILKDGRKKPLNFALLKAKEGVVLKAHPLKSSDVMFREAKAAGGLPAICCTGVLNVVGKLMTMNVVEEDVQRSLPKQAKKHFANLGVPCKVVIVLPGGATIDDEDEDDITGAPSGPRPTETVAPGIEAPVEDDAKAALTERIKVLAPQVKDAVARAAAGADKLGTALKAAATDIADGALDRAAKLVEAVEAALQQGAAGVSVDAAALRESLLNEFNSLSGNLQVVVTQGPKAVSGKADQIVAMFRAELGRDLKKAASVLNLLRGFLETEAAKLAPKAEAEGLFSDIVKGVGDALGDIGGQIGETLEKAAEAVDAKVAEITEAVTAVATGVVEGAQDLYNDVTGTPEERSARGLADALGYAREDREKLIERMKTDPKAHETLAREKMKASGVPDDRQAELLKMALHDPKAFVAALGSLAEIDKGGPVDISADAVEKSMEALDKARTENEAKQKLAADAATALQASMKAYGETGTKTAGARGKADEAAKAIEDLKSRVGDPTKLTPEEKLKFAQESRKLINDNEVAKAALEEAIEAEKKASMDYAAAAEKNTGAQTAADASKEKLGGAQAVQDAKDGKKSLIDAMAFGPLSPSGKLSDEDKARFAGAYGKNAKVADGLLNMAQSAKNPSLLAENAGLLADTATNGFAAPDGRKLDLPPEQLAQMALNAGRMGDMAGGDYFKDFDAYLKSGKQIDPDPTGGLDAPLADAKAEETRRKNVAQARTRDMANAAVKPDGTVDFASDAAKGAMDHAMFHPGALNVFTPQMNMKAVETQKLFTDDATKAKAQGIITGTTLPGASTPAKPTSPNSAKSIIGKTMKKDPAAVTDTDARASVLSAMMTPMSQGPVGSCFSTAPVRGIRETDPLRAMDQYSKIAGTGLFTPNGKPGVPANQRSHDGENPLMRSWEYSVAAASANQTDSVQRGRVNKALLRPGDSANNLGAIKGIMGATDAEWNGYNDASTGDAVEGMRSKLLGAAAKRLKFDYNATAPKAGAGGDGHSSEGRYQLLFDGVAINSEDEFKAAIKKITLGVTGEAEDSPKGAQIVTLVTSAAFIQSVKDAMKTGGAGADYLPWQLSSGGFEDAAKKTLDGGNPEREAILAEVGTPAPTRTDRTAGILTAVMGKHGSMTGDMHTMGTSGVDAGHAFNALPNDPSMDKIRDPGSAGKIDRELVQPGRTMAATALTPAQCARMYEDEVRRLIDLLPDASERAALTGLLKKAPTSPLKPAEIAAKVKAECRSVIPQMRADAYVKTKEPAATNERKAAILTFYQDQFDTGFAGAIEAGLRERMMDTLKPPQVTVADSNWGGSENQVFFVAAPDPLTGDLIMWKRTDPGGKMTALGKNWEDGPWTWVKP